jgi:glycosyltransferase involved in cell wall biosynthesis
MRLSGLRVCFVTSHPPSRGRLSEYAFCLLSALESSRRISRIFVLTDSKPERADSLRGQRVDIRQVWTPDNAASILKVLVNVLLLRPDVVHFNVHFQSFGRSRLANFIGLSLPFLCKALGTPSVATVHNLGEKVDLKAVGLKPSFLNRHGIRLATRLITSASAVTVTVRSYLEFLNRSYGCANVTFVPHGAGVSSRPPTPLPINPSRMILIFGHMAPFKGLPLMIDVFSRVLNERKDVKLIVAGESHPNFPRYLDDFSRNPPPKVEFVGYVDERQLPSLFERAFVVVLPYLAATGTSGVFHLACGYGKPIIASDLPEIRELVKEGASAILVPPNDVEGFAKAILRLCDTPWLAEEIGNRNLSFASTESWNLVASSFERIYMNLAAR